MRKLQKLHLFGKNIEGGLAAWSNLTELHDILFNNCKGDIFRGVEHWTTLSRLQTLVYHNCPDIEPHSFRLLSSLRVLPNLWYVKIHAGPNFVLSPQACAVLRSLKKPKIFCEYERYFVFSNNN